MAGSRRPCSSDGEPGRAQLALEPTGLAVGSLGTQDALATARFRGPGWRQHCRSAGGRGRADPRSSRRRDRRFVRRSPLRRGLRAKAPISTYEAMLVEMLACGVAAGLARVEQEQNAAAARVQFEQFFTKELSLQLTAQPDLLQGRDEDVTLLFCDIRGFSSISEAMGPAGTVEWIGDVMNTLSECVSEDQGVLVDYIGDELMAMWGSDQAAQSRRVGLSRRDRHAGSPP